MQTKYCIPSTPFSQSQPSTSQASAEACPKPLSTPSKKTQDPLIASLTICKNPHKAEQPNDYSQVLCLPGTVEHNVKAQRLEDFIECEVNMYVTKVYFNFYIFYFI